MKTKVEYTLKGPNDMLTIAMRKGGFPWWVLLLLLPLLLLIPIKRDLNCQIVDGGDVPLAMVPANFSYNDVGVFGARTPRQAHAITSEEGKCTAKDVREPLWYYLFVDNDTLTVSTENDCPRLDNHREIYKEFHRGQYKKMVAASSMVSDTFTVVNKKTGEPLPDAKVTVEIIMTGQVSNKEFLSDANGKVFIGNLTSCASVRIIASKEGFIPDSLDTPVAAIPDMTAAQKTLRLMPEVPLVGKDGKLRINLQWNTQTDLDLVVFDPCGNSISFSHRKAVCKDCKGELDVDANYRGTLTDTPQENIYWEKIAPGTYRVCVLGWDNKRPCDASAETDFNVSIIQEGNRTDVPGKFLREKLLKVNGGSQRWDTQDYLVYEFTVEE